MERIEYLRDVQKSLEGAIKEAIAIAIASPIINIFVKRVEVFLVITLIMSAFTIYAAYNLFRIQREVRYLWEELMARDPIYERIPPIAVFGILAAIASIIALLLTW